MPTLLAVASVIATITGVVHSVLGEHLIFRHLREPGAIVPTRPAPPLQARNVRILWATWHLASVLAWALAALLWRLARDPAHSLPGVAVLWIALFAFLAGSLLVLVGTRGRHPGWLALGLVGVLCGIAAGSMA